MMATKAKEAEIEEAENFIPCCFRVMRDKKGKTLKVKIPIFNYLLPFLNLRSSQEEHCITGVQYVCRSFEIHNAESPKGRQHDEKR